MFGFEHGWIFGFVVSRLLDGQEFWVLAFIVYSFSDLKNAKTLLSLSFFFLAFKGNDMFARKTTRTHTIDYIQNGYLNVDSVLQ